MKKTNNIGAKINMAFLMLVLSVFVAPACIEKVAHASEVKESSRQRSINMTEVETTYSLSCRYYVKQTPCENECEYSGEWFSKTFTVKGFYGSINFKNVLDMTSPDKKYRFAIISGDEGTQFLLVSSLITKMAALTHIEFDSDIAEPGYMSVFLSETNFDATKGFMGGDAGIQCSIEKQ